MPHVSREFDEIDWIVSAAESEHTVQYRRYCDWYEGFQDEKLMMAETRKVSTAYQQLGWSQGKTIKRIMSMPLHLFTLLRKIDPEFGHNSKEGKSKVYRFLLRHPQFSVK